MYLIMIHVLPDGMVPVSVELYVLCLFLRKIHSVRRMLVECRKKTSFFVPVQLNEFGPRPSQTHAQRQLRATAVAYVIIESFLGSASTGEKRASTMSTAQEASASTSSTAQAATLVAEETMVDTNPQASFLQRENEGVLGDVLAELDRERSKRAELEQKVRALEEDLYAQKMQSASKASTSMRDYNTLKAERDGYLEIVDALTRDRPAFTFKQTLPLHVVRLLEVMPWDPRARAHLFGKEEIYEWQIYSSNRSWHKELRHFPTIFKTLPIVVPRSGKTVGEAPSSSSPPKYCVLTNLEVTQILNIDKGYPLPDDGADWTWIGGWRIELDSDTDEKGWSYSNDPQITSESSYYSDLRMPKKGTRNLVRRRRKWCRLRVMIDYAQASSMTKEYLKLLAEKAELDINVEKLSSQLVDTKMSLTNLQAEHLELEEQLSRQGAELEKERQEKNKILDLLDAGIDKNGNSEKKDQVKELKSAVTQLFSTVSKRNNSDTISTSGSDEEETTGLATTPGANTKPQMFGSLKDKGSGFFEKLKQKSGEEFEKIKQKSGEEFEKIKQSTDKNLPWQRKGKGDGLTEQTTQTSTEQLNN